MANPLHSNVREKLDPEYVAFHDEYLADWQPPNYSLWDPSIRSQKSPMGLADLAPVDVKSTKDIQIADELTLRVYSPDVKQPEEGLPIFVWLHGGGYCLGNAESDKPVLTYICRDTPCIVVTVVYRLAPEHPFPDALDDTRQALQWINAYGEEELGANTQKIVIGGSSAGANLAAVVTLEMPDLLQAQILIVPLIDNTATPSSEHWLKNEHAPGLPPQRMYSFIVWEFPNPKDRQQWKASPNRAPKEIFKDGRVPKAFIKVAGVDLLYEDGVKYAEFLKQNGVEVDLKEYEGVPHQVFIMAGALTKGREMLEDIIENLRGVFK